MKTIIEFNFSGASNYLSDWMQVYLESWKNSIYKLSTIQIHWKNAIENCGEIQIQLSNDGNSYTKYFSTLINSTNNDSNVLILDTDILADYFRFSYIKNTENQGIVTATIIYRKI